MRNWSIIYILLIGLTVGLLGFCTNKNQSVKAFWTSFQGEFKYNDPLLTDRFFTVQGWDAYSKNFSNETEFEDFSEVIFDLPVTEILTDSVEAKIFLGTDDGVTGRIVLSLERKYEKWKIHNFIPRR